MASRTQAGSRFGRRIVWLAVAIVVVALAYTGLWFYLARTLEERTAAAVARLNGGGVRAHCEEPDARGYPFRLGLFCRAVFYENVRSGVSVRAGAFRSAAQVYQPFHVLGELDGPATIVLPVGPALEAAWESLRASTRLARPLPESLSVEGRGFVISHREGDGAPLATAEAAQLHARPQGQDLEAAATFNALALGEQLAPGLPPLEGRVRMVVEGGISMLDDGPLDPRGRSARIEDLTVGAVGREAGISLSGPIAVSEDGFVDADLAVRVDDAAAVAAVLAEAFPDSRDEITGAMGALGALGDTPIQLRVVRGRAFVGFIPVGTIPPL